MRSSRTRTVGAIFVAAVALLAVAPSASQSRDTSLHTGMCAVAEVPGVLVMPDGNRREVAEIKICLERWLSPSSGIHVLYLDGRPWGMLLSSVGKDEDADADRPVVVYSRDDLSNVRLLGYAWPHRHSMLTLTFARPGSKSRPSDLLKDDGRPDSHVQVAARAE